jgi:hypothetical protein
MNLNPEIIDDLLAVYLAGEASNETRRLVEDYLAAHPDTASRVKEAQTLTVPRVSAPPEPEQQAIARTRALLIDKSLWLVCALTFSYLPLLTFTDEKSGTFFVLLRDQPLIAGILLVAGLGCWIAFLRACRRLQVTGLQPLRTRKARALWALGGVGALAPIGLAIGHWVHQDLMVLAFSCGGAFGSLIGEKFGQIPEFEHPQPISLFHPPQDRE